MRQQAEQAEPLIPASLAAAIEETESVAVRSQWSVIWLRFRRDKTALLGLAIVLALIAVAVFAPLLAPHDPAQIFDNGLTLDGTPAPPGSAFPLGADALGHDQLSRIIYGARVSLTIGIVANGLAVLIGMIVGALGGYYSGVFGTIMMRLTDVMMAFPVLLLAIALVAVLKPSIWIIIGVIAFIYWTPIARIVHGQVLGLKEREFVEAARAVGVGDGRILRRHILPHKAAMVWSGGEAWLQDFPDPSDFYGPILSCASAVQGGWNWPFLCDKKLDALATKLKATTDRNARLAGYRTLYRQVMAQAPWVPVDNDVKYVLHGSQVHGQAADFVHNVHTYFYEHIWKG